MKKQTKRLFLGCLALLLIALLLFGLYQSTKPAVQIGEKRLTIAVTGPDNQTNSHSLSTYAENLGTALIESGLAQGEKGAFGLFIVTVAGYTADQSKQEWWCITKGGEKINTGADETVIADGETYELTLKVGY